MSSVWPARFESLLESMFSAGADADQTENLTQLGRYLVKSSPPGPQVDWIRNQAFAKASAKLGGPDAAPALELLRRVVEAIEHTALQPHPVAEAYFMPGNAGRNRLINLFDNAQRSALVCVFTITDDRIADAILRCHRRGVLTRVISDNDKALDPGADIISLQQNGVPVAVDQTPAHMHNKFAVFDNNLLATGSYNWTWSASSKNNENFIVTSEQYFINRFIREHEKLWKEFRSGDAPSPDYAATRIQAAARGHLERRSSSRRSSSRRS